ncbi:MAG: hypothetical protein WBH03_07950, partial [Cyclobacteriaceae bacterium]
MANGYDIAAFFHLIVCWFTLLCPYKLRFAILETGYHSCQTKLIPAYLLDTFCILSQADSCDRGANPTPRIPGVRANARASGVDDVLTLPFSHR